MSFDVVRRFPGVGFDADDVDAARAVVLRELFHALIVAVGHGALYRDEDQDSSILAFEGRERALRATGIRQLEIGNRRADGGDRLVIVSSFTNALNDSAQDKRERQGEREYVVLPHLSLNSFQNIGATPKINSTGE